MRRTTFRTARKRLFLSGRKLGAGVLMMGLAMSASAKDGSTLEQAANSRSQTPQAAAKVGKKSRHWLQTGLASWYGEHFQGRKTAGGESFDMNQMTCAHPSLPMGTWLRVTNLRNRRSTFVRVNDRGPVVDGRIVDLSMAAAQTLGLAGVGQVRLESVRENDPELAKALVAQLQMPALFETENHPSGIETLPR
jgi:rare lipoprotein A